MARLTFVHNTDASLPLRLSAGDSALQQPQQQGCAALFVQVTLKGHEPPPAEKEVFTWAKCASNFNSASWKYFLFLYFYSNSQNSGWRQWSGSQSQVQEMRRVRRECRRGLAVEISPALYCSADCSHRVEDELLNSSESSLRNGSMNTLLELCWLCPSGHLCFSAHTGRQSQHIIRAFVNVQSC